MKKIAYVIIIIAIIIFSFSRIKSILMSGNSFLKTLEPIFNNPLASYDEKMEIKYPVYYDFIQNVKRITPENSIIYLPQIKILRPKKMWAIGSIQITQALLYPRDVEKLSLNNLPLRDDLNKNTYIIVAKEFPGPYFFNSELLLVVNNENIAPRHYDPLDFGKNNMVGLMAVE